MDSEDLFACLSLLRLPGVGDRTLLRLLNLAGSPRDVRRLGPAELAMAGLRADVAEALSQLHARPDQSVARQCAWLLGNRIEILTIPDPSYPAALRACPSPPPILFVRGDPSCLGGPYVAIVGSRHPTPSGRELAHELAAGTVGRGLGVVSGLAIGIDTAAHQGALAGTGRTVAVLGTGHDRVYPARNAALAQRIVAEGGALVSEFPPGVGPEPANFPRRNRIVSGLSLGVLVVEAGLPSGSLLTAQHAAEQGREVMAVPGSVRSPVSRGCHELLRHGAALIESAEDIVCALGDRFAPAIGARPAGARAAVAPPTELSPTEQQVLDSIGYEETSADLIVARAHLSAALVTATLVSLELRGVLESGPCGYSRK